MNGWIKPENQRKYTNLIARADALFFQARAYDDALNFDAANALAKIAHKLQEQAQALVIDPRTLKGGA